MLMHDVSEKAYPNDRMIRAVQMDNITKIYEETGTLANNQVNLVLHKGEILCLAGENGAGKTTLMKILYGMERPDTGSIAIYGRRVHINSPLEANRLGIGMVHQHVMLIDDFTVAQNVTLGKEPIIHAVAYDEKRAEQLVEDIILRHHFSIIANQLVSSLSIGQKQQVEIVKMLYRNVDILILDEPTAVLTEQEIRALFVTLRSLIEQGKSLILITHKLNEIKAISDRVAIMRQGRMIAEAKTDSVDEYEISRMMMGKNVGSNIHKPSPVLSGRREIFRVSNVSVIKRDSGNPLLNNISFSSYSGEILGFAGVGGNGLTELEGILTGMLSVSQGTLEYRDTDVTKADTRKLRAMGMAYVPGDRLHTGVALEATVGESLIIHARHRLSRIGFMQRKKLAQYYRTLSHKYAIQGSMHMLTRMLSGGNIQKLILAREIDQWRDLIIFSEPTWGLDSASSQFVYDQIWLLKEQGAAIVLISSNIDEILSLSDKIIVMHRGKIVARFNHSTNEVTKEKIGTYMLGLAHQGATDGD
ncbi:MAG: ABC transporter ATP-binding protein [Sphaerochaetaceae bacterium]|nr:ABC transporter ATP-binding protein [Sphaerochaetaceae bacterium]